MRQETGDGEGEGEGEGDRCCRRSLTHYGRLLGRAGRVSHDPGDQHGDVAEQEGEEVVADEQRGAVARGPRDGVEHGEAGDDGEHEGDHDDRLVAEALDGPRGREDYDPLDEAEGDVEEGGQVWDNSGLVGGFEIARGF